MIALTIAQVKYELTLNLLAFIIIYFILVFVFYTWRKTKYKELFILSLAFTALMLKNLLTVFVDYRYIFMDVLPFEPTYSIATITLETMGYILIAGSLLSHFLRKYKKYVSYFFYGIVILLFMFLVFVQIDYANDDSQYFENYGVHLSPREHAIHNFSEIYSIVFLFFGFFFVFNNWKSDKSTTLMVMMLGMLSWIVAHIILLVSATAVAVPEMLKTVAIVLLAYSFAFKKELPIKIVPAHEVVEKKIEGSKYHLKPSSTYYFKEEKPDKTFECFVDQVMHGNEGLSITRIYPDKVRKNYGLSRTPIIWLTQTPTEKFKYIKPTSLVQLANIIEEFINESDDNIIMIDGVDYLITQNTFQEVLKFFQNLVEKVALLNSILVLSLNHNTMENKEFNLIISNMEELH